MLLGTGASESVESTEAAAPKLELIPLILERELWCLLGEDPLRNHWLLDAQGLRINRSSNHFLAA